MNITILCNDTRGGVQPYVALALALRARGHRVRAAAPADLAPMFSGVGVEASALEGRIEDMLRASGGAAERGPIAAMRLAAREMPPRIRSWTRTALEACEGADVVLGGVGGMVMGLSVAEKLGIPFVEAHLQPIGAPTDRYPGVLFAGTPRWLGRWALRASHQLTELALWKPFEGAMRTARREVLGLTGPPRPPTTPVLYGLSRHVVPIPDDPARPRHVTGYWFLPAPSSWAPSPELAAFLERPGPVVSIGFGSMTSADPRSLTTLVRDAARRAGVRVVLLSGWGGLEAQHDGDVLSLDAVPHDWLFARVAATVHHGGAGTTGAALRAGVPTLVVPFTMDQPFWGARVAALGVGPAPIARRALRVASLAEGLRQMIGDASMRARAASLGERIRAEDGVGEAVRHLEASVSG
jgi:UDP:flavonoid glycosyltransferase YjiC (YdhE family)